MIHIITKSTLVDNCKYQKGLINSDVSVNRYEYLDLILSECVNNKANYTAKS